MATFFYNWTGEVAGTQPSNTYYPWNTPSTGVIDTSTFGYPVYKESHVGNTEVPLVFGEVPLSTTIEVVARVRTTYVDTGSGTDYQMDIVTRGSGNGSTKTGRTTNFLRGTYINCEGYNNNTSFTFGSGSSRSFSANQWYWIRVRTEGNITYYRVWNDGATEPTSWDSASTTNVTGAGWAGIGSWSGNGTRYWSQVGIATDGDTAPIAPKAGYKDGFGYRKMFTVLDSQVPAGSNYYGRLMIDYTDAKLKSVSNGGVIQQSGANLDIAFYDNAAPQSRLLHEIQSYDPATGHVIAWVQVPNGIVSGTSPQIYMMYANPMAFDWSQKRGLWSLAFPGVFHLDKSLSGTTNGLIDAQGFEDSSANNIPVDTSLAYLTSSGKINSALDAYDNRVSVVQASSIYNMGNNYTWRVWVRQTDATGNQAIFGRRSTGGADSMALWSLSGVVNIDVNGAGGRVNTGYTLPINTWVQLTVTKSPTQVKLYVNGSLQSTTGNTQTANTASTVKFGIGCMAEGDARQQFFRGQIDEVMLVTALWTPERVLWEYRNQNNPSSTYSVGSEESGWIVVNDSIQSGKIRIQKDITKDQPGTLRIQTTTTQDTIGKLRVQVKYDKDQTGRISIRGDSLRDQPGKIRLQQTLNIDQSGKLRIQLTVDQETIGKLRVSGEPLRLQQGVLRIQKTISETIPGRLRISISSEVDTTGKLRISQIAEESQDGRLRIQNNLLQAQTGKLRIYRLINAIQTGKLRISRIVEHDQTGKLLIIQTNEQQQIGVISIKNKIVFAGIYKQDYRDNGQYTQDVIDSAGLLHPTYRETGILEAIEPETGTFKPDYIKR